MRLLEEDELKQQREGYPKTIDSIDKFVAGVVHEVIDNDRASRVSLVLTAKLLKYLLVEQMHMAELLEGMKKRIGKLESLALGEIPFTPDDDPEFTTHEELLEDQADALVRQMEYTEQEWEKLKEEEAQGQPEISPDEVLATLEEIDAEGREEARRIADEIDRMAKRADDEEVD